ncbi:MAG: c-type cytochrome [Gammaproteobacteria bacterium]|nr:c-type cytochrome [Gammaproteobacteria bacterium]
MKRIITVVVLASSFVAAPAMANLDLAKASGCLACHSVDAKVVGPAWKDVAAKYKGQGDAKATLVESIKKGSKGKWTAVTGGVPMPPYSPRVADENINKLADFILGL